MLPYRAVLGIGTCIFCSGLALWVTLHADAPFMPIFMWAIAPLSLAALIIER